MTDTKIIILRGPSGSGKSTVARLLREHLKDSVALIEHDYVRRIILKEKDKPESLNGRLLLQMVTFALNNGYHVILDGILPKKYYDQLFAELWRIHPANNHLYYFDISFEETLRRHQTRAKVHEFGEAEMKRWWHDNDHLGVEGERSIPEHLSADEIVDQILHDAGLLRTDTLWDPDRD